MAGSITSIWTSMRPLKEFRNLITRPSLGLVSATTGSCLILILIKAFLWAYEHTGAKVFLDRAETGLTQTMQLYPNLKWTEYIRYSMQLSYEDSTSAQ